MVGVIAPIYSGAAAGVVGIADMTLSAHGIGIYKLEADGDIMRQLTELGAFNDAGDWIAPKPPAAGYQVRSTLVGYVGDLPGGTFGTWLSMASDNEWGQGAFGSNSSCAFTIEIRHGTGPVLDAATILINVADGSIPPP